MFLSWHILMIPARMVGGSTHPEKIKEMDKELTKVIEDFNHAVDVEALRLAKKNGTIHCPYLVMNVLNGLCRARVPAYTA